VILLSITHGHLTGPDTELSKYSVPLRIIGIISFLWGLGGLLVVGYAIYYFFDSL
jgi:hypothetical protein